MEPNSLDDLDNLQTKIQAPDRGLGLQRRLLLSFAKWGAIAFGGSLLFTFAVAFLQVKINGKEINGIPSAVAGGAAFGFLLRTGMQVQDQIKEGQL